MASREPLVHFRPVVSRGLCPYCKDARSETNDPRRVTCYVCIVHMDRIDQECAAEEGYSQFTRVRAARVMGR